MYLQMKVYGDRPGNFYGDDGVRLYLPAKLLETDNVQMNYVAGYGNGNVIRGVAEPSGSPQRDNDPF